MKIVYKVALHLSLFLALSFLAQLAAGGEQQSKREVKGNGYTLSRYRDVDSFTAVRIAGDIELFITQGEALPVKVTADDNLFPYIVTDVYNGCLYVHIVDSVALKRGHGTSVFVAIPEIDFIGADMGAKVKSANSLNCNVLKVSSENGAEVVIKGSVDSLYRHSGAGGVINSKKIIAKYSGEY